MNWSRVLPEMDVLGYPTLSMLTERIWSPFVIGLPYVAGFYLFCYQNFFQSYKSIYVMINKHVI